MMGITTVLINNEETYHLLYSSQKFVDGLTVTGYFIYPDMSKSDIFTFDPLGDGIYYVKLPHTRKTSLNVEKYGLVVKEDGVVKKFEMVHIQN